MSVQSQSQLSLLRTETVYDMKSNDAATTDFGSLHLCRGSSRSKALYTIRLEDIHNTCYEGNFRAYDHQVDVGFLGEYQKIGGLIRRKRRDVDSFANIPCRAVSRGTEDGLHSSRLAEFPGQSMFSPSSPNQQYTKALLLCHALCELM